MEADIAGGIGSAREEPPSRFPSRWSWCLLAFLSILVTPGLCFAQAGLAVAASHRDAVYQLGETIEWSVQATNGNVAGAEVVYTVKKGGLTVIKEGKLDLAGGRELIRMPASEPGTLLLEVKAQGTNNQKLRELAAAVIAPAQIRSAHARPADFDKFWKAKLKELSKVPANSQLVPGVSEREGIDYWQISMDNIRGSQIRGQLARPAGRGKLPALLVVQWAGVYGLQKAWINDRAAAGWLVLNINAHDLPIDQPPAFYEEQFKGPLKDYWAIGNDDRDQSYFLRMYLSCYRAAQYLVERRDWDGKTLVVMGTSQGGQQALMTAGFHPRITAAVANVPAGCDLAGPEVGRSPGWPGWYYRTAGKDPVKVVETSRYYDVVNFATRIKCPVLVGVGLVDETCPPEGILAAMNQIKGQKEVVLLPQSDHQGRNNTHQAFNDRSAVWLAALVKGQGIPPR